MILIPLLQEQWFQYLIVAIIIILLINLLSDFSQNIRYLVINIKDLIKYLIKFIILIFKFIIKIIFLPFTIYIAIKDYIYLSSLIVNNSQCKDIIYYE